VAETDASSGKWRRRWASLWRAPKSRWMFGVPTGAILAFAVGILFWGGFNTAMEMSSTETFCISCHEMADNVYVEYQETIHYSNRTGVRATCPDCHVPKPWGAKVARKIQATLHEIPNWAMGTIDTHEKFEAHRLKLATGEWTRLKNNNSLECRNCHELEHMDLAVQGRSASRRHNPERVAETGDTCIDCHQGIAHHLPEGWEDIPLWEGIL
jgi:cytochrome c-type protein NapC